MVKCILFLSNTIFKKRQYILIIHLIIYLKMKTGLQIKWCIKHSVALSLHVLQLYVNSLVHMFDSLLSLTLWHFLSTGVHWGPGKTFFLVVHNTSWAPVVQTNLTVMAVILKMGSVFRPQMLKGITGDLHIHDALTMDITAHMRLLGAPSLLIGWAIQSIIQCDQSNPNK